MDNEMTDLPYALWHRCAFNDRLSTISHRHHTEIIDITKSDELPHHIRVGCDYGSTHLGHDRRPALLRRGAAKSPPGTRTAGAPTTSCFPEFSVAVKLGPETGGPELRHQ